MEYSSFTTSVKYEVADIFRLYGEDYRSQNGMTKKQHAVMNAIMNCRTTKYGYHMDMCEQCGHKEKDFNSCRDRHCPKCQGINRRKWIKARLKDILPVPYYHVVFTLPHFINPILSYNKAFIYELLFSSSSETLLALGRNPKWLGGEMGFYGVLHTWGQTLWQHAHIHYIVPGGALTEEGKWVEPDSPDTFLFPFKALSKVFRGKFIQGLKKAHTTGQLDLPEELEYLQCKESFEYWIDKFVSRDWVVYCKPPFGDAEDVVKYIGRYTHRVAITNSRIIDIKDHQIRFLYKDYQSDRISWKDMTLSAQKFIQRFLSHILPKGFHKIRHYGYLANGHCRACVSFIKQLLCQDPQNYDVANVDHGDGVRCPECGEGFMIPMIVLNGFGQMIQSFFSRFDIISAYDTSQLSIDIIAKCTLHHINKDRKLEQIV